MESQPVGGIVFPEIPLRAALGEIADGGLPALRVCIMSPSTQQPPGNRTNDGFRPSSISARSGRRPLGRSFHVFFGKQRNHVQPDRAGLLGGDHQPALRVGAVGSQREP